MFKEDLSQDIQSKKESAIKEKIKHIFINDVGLKISDSEADVFKSMIQFIYECIDEDKFVSIEFSTQEMKDSINKAIMRIILLDKENDNPDDFTILCRFLSKTLSEKSSSDKEKNSQSEINFEVPDKLNID